MSYPPNLLLSQSEVPLKTFIKEKNEPACVLDKQTKSQLQNFEGNELEKAYDEILSDKSTKSTTVVRVKKRKQKTPQKINNVVPETNVNVLFKAIESGDKSFVSQHMTAENVNILDQFGWTPLMVAAGAGHIELVDFLLELGAYKCIQDKSGLTAADIALKKHHFDIVNLLSHQPKKKKKKVASKNDTQESKKSEIEPFYCDTCKMEISDSSRKKHETSIIHTFNCEPKLSTYYGISKANKGYQMMLNTGWNEDGGLGPSGEGQKYPVKTVLKRDRKGLGQAENKTARVTHFDPKDPRAVETVKKNDRRVYKMRDRKIQLKKEAAKDRALRRAIS